MRHFIKVLAVAVIGLLSGCASGPSRTPIEDALDVGDVSRFRALATPAAVGTIDPSMFGRAMAGFAPAPGPATALEMVKTILDTGADPNHPFTGLPHSILWFLCSQPEAMAYAIRRGADIRQRLAPPGMTGVQDSTVLGNCEIQATMYHRQHKQMVEGGYTGAVRYFAAWRNGSVKSAAVLLEAGADPNEFVLADTGAGKRLMPISMDAFGAGVNELGLLFLAHGADPLATNGRGTNLLHASVGRGDIPTTTVLIKRARSVATKQAGSDAAGAVKFKRWLNAQTEEGNTALHLASAQLNTGMISLLIRSGADYTLRNAAGQTAQDVADLKREHNEMERQARLERQRKQAQEAEQSAREAAVTRQGVLALLGAAAIGKATSGKNFTYEQRSSLVDAWTRDRMNAADGVTTDNFAAAASRTRDQLNIARMAQEAKIAQAQAAATSARGGADARPQSGSAAGPAAARSVDSSAPQQPGSSDAAAARTPGYPKIVNAVWEDAQLNENTVKGWCQSKPAELKTDLEAAGDEVLQIGACTCSDVSMTKVLQGQYSCKFPYTFKQNRSHGEK